MPEAETGSNGREGGHTLDGPIRVMFRWSSDDIDMFMEAAVGFIGKLAGEAVHKPVIRTFPTQKP